MELDSKSNLSHVGGENHKDRNQRPWQVLALLVVLLVIFPSLVAASLTNAGSLALIQATLAHEGKEPEEQNARLLERARARFEQALALNEDHPAARWGVARANLALGRSNVGTIDDFLRAADVLRPLAVDGTPNLLLFRDTLMAFSYAGQPEQVIDLCQSSLPLVGALAISDTLALAHLQRGATGDLVQALALRPGDLYANYHLWQAAQEVGDVQAAAVYSSTLVWFPVEAVHPVDVRLLDYTAEVIPALLESGLWDKGVTTSVVSFLVWKHQDAVGVERLLGNLMGRFPAEPDWPFYLAELHHRQGNLANAQQYYLDVLVMDQDYASAYLRLGMVAEASCEPRIAGCRRAEEAIGWYGKYNIIVPDDLLGLKKLTEACIALEEAGESNMNCQQAAERMIRQTRHIVGGSPAAVLREALEFRTDDRWAVAELLDVAVEDVELGPNLVRHGGGEELENGEPRGWIWADMATGDPWNKGGFAGGTDGLNTLWGNTAIHIEGFWLQSKPELEFGRVGYWQWDEAEKNLREIEILPGQPYLISFYYNTERVSDSSIALWVSHDESALFSGYHRLPPTNGEWWRFTKIGWNRAESAKTIRLLISLLSPGGVWFDDVAIRRITSNAGNTDVAAPTLFGPLEFVLGRGP